MDVSPAIDGLPGFRRRVIVTPGPRAVRAAVEDDYHRMHVTLRHEAGIVTAIEAVMERAPWTTCPGAESELVRTFTGLPLVDFAARGAKSANCTHLHDLAVLAAAHAGDAARIVFDILVSDAVDARRHLELRRDGVPLFRWEETGGVLTAPAAVAGETLFGMKRWLAGLTPAEREAAKLLRWGSIIAHGRAIPLAQQSDARRMPEGNCYTFQRERQAVAERVGAIHDFSGGGAPLADA